MSLNPKNSGSVRGLDGFDPEHFGKKAELGLTPGSVEVFREAFHSNLWNGQSRSGPGSTSGQTARIASAIPRLCERLEVHRLLDVPCGDFSWMASLEMPNVFSLGLWAASVLRGRLARVSA